MKKVAIGFTILVLLLTGAAFYLHSNLDSLVKTAIEKYGTAATQSEVRVGSVMLSLTTGEGTLNGLSVANPKGFSAAKALSFGMISVKVDTGSITGNGPIIIREIVVDKSQVKFEATNNGDSNLQAIQRNATAGAASSAGDNSDQHRPGRKVIISDLYIRNGQIDITHPLLQGRALSASLPTIHLTNIGKGDGGASPSEVADLVLKSITSSATKIASSDLVKNLGSLKAIQNAAPAGIMKNMNGLLGR